MSSQPRRSETPAGLHATSFDDGLYQVGVAIQPGQYHTGGSVSCYWAKLASGDTNRVIVNNIVNNNLDWYNSNYTNNPGTNKLGVITNGYVFAYNDGHGLAPWQDDFFTSAIGHAAELGFTKANALLTREYRKGFEVPATI